MNTPKQLAEKIGIEYHGIHHHTTQFMSKQAVSNTDYRSWEAFLACTHEICEDSRTLIGNLEYQARLLKDCELYIPVEAWEELSGREPVNVD